MRIGILGGTFDPIHQAHIHIARGTRLAFGLDQVWFMVANLPPHKRKDPITSPFHRFAMTAAAIQDEPHFYASDWELRRPGPSYTIETLACLAADFPSHEFCFLAGSDSLREIHLWKDYDKLLLRHCFIFVQRPGAEVDLDQLQGAGWLRQVIRPIEENKQPSIQPGRSFLINLDSPPVSSTLIRQMLSAGVPPPEQWIPAAVRSYICKYGVYENNRGNSQESLQDN